MRKIGWLLIIVLFFAHVVSGQYTSIYDIQYTSNPGNGTYPSPFVGQSLTVGGIITATDYNNGNYFISSSNGGEWEGLFVYDFIFSPDIGDSIIISGEVYEYNGFTELKNLTDFEIISNSNSLPTPYQISTNELFTEEAFESVFVGITDINVSQTYDEWDEWHVNDGSGSCIIADAIFSLKNTSFPLIQGYPFSSIVGVVSYSYNKFMLHPRSIDDIQSSAGAYILSVNDMLANSLNEFEYPVWLSFLGSSVVNDYEFILQYDPTVIDYAGYSQNGNLSSAGIVSDLSVPGEVHLVFTGSFSFSGVEELIGLNFVPKINGSSTMSFLSATLDGNPIQYFISGQIDSNIGDEPLGDTLTVIQKPLLNIPEIVVPGENFEIICVAAPTVTNWQVSLIHKDYSVQLQILESVYQSELVRWCLTTVAPYPELFELFDLKVTATGIIDDVTVDAVQVIPQEKDSYYFIHITDTHLPTHYFYPDPLAESDTSEIVDFREVVNDINLINPEFVLLTGDFINEGELEDFENRRYFSMAQRLLTELDVPVYLVSGNHDIGGWLETPAANGTARHNWWRFFGWKWLQNPSGSELNYTQNFSFDYGNTHYVGMESYINYDGYMSTIYGNTSFIQSQLDWLADDLLSAPPNNRKVLFYHKDFDDQINLSAMDIDMALYGHIHSNSGNINQHPYNLSTDNICDGSRAYRVIRVNNESLQPYSSVSAGSSGENLEIEYFPANNGFADSVAAQITNNHDIEFEHALVKFMMPKGNYNYEVINGDLLQVDNTGNFAICYVNANVPANDNITVIIKANITLDLIVDIKAFLEGPFHENEMKAFLNESDILVINQPYNVAPWNYSGNESVASIPNENVVDWVLVELRDASDAASAIPASTVERQAAFVLKDGSIVGTNGSSPLTCTTNIIHHNLYVVIYHRNHLAVMSANALMQAGGIYTYNFTSGENQAYESYAEGQKEISNGLWGMYSGDATADGGIDGNDRIIWGNHAGKKGYNPADLNMDGQVNNNDKNDMIIPNNNSQSQIPE